MSRPTGSRAVPPRTRRPLSTVVLLALVGLGATEAALAQQDPGGTDWPCPQVLVRRISLPAVWSGPSIEGMNWRNDPIRVERVARLAARRTPIEDARKTIEDVANAVGSRKDFELVALFAGLFETLDAERTEVIDGLVRFGRKQRDLAETIKSEQAAIREGRAAPGTAPDAQPATTRLEWNLRVFEERRHALASVCESPALIEQRLFALARAIEQALD
jgi:hypothetical protein